MVIRNKGGVKIRVDNIHYDLTEEDLDVCFSARTR